jgi:flagellar biogenesis protein FliO
LTVVRAIFVLCIALVLCPPPVRAADGGSGKESTLPFKRTEEVASTTPLWRVVLSFGVVVAIGFGAAYAVRRYIPASVGRAIGSAGRIEVLEVRRITPKLTVYLIQADGEKFLLTQSGDRVTSQRMSLSSPGVVQGNES